MDYTLTYEKTVKDGSLHVLVSCSCGWEWTDVGIIGYNEKDVLMGAKSRQREHLTAIGASHDRT